MTKLRNQLVTINIVYNTCKELQWILKPLDETLMWNRIFCCYCSVTKSCPTLCAPMDWSFPVFHYLLEIAQIHVD